MEIPKPVQSPMQKWARSDVEVYQIGLDAKNAREFNMLVSTGEYQSIYSDTLPSDTSIISVNGHIEMMSYAEKHGYDAAFVSCFADPGVIEGRGVVNIPIVGACEASMYLASMLGQNFSIIVNFPIDIPRIIEKAKFYGVYEKIKSFRSIDMSTRERGSHFSRGDPEKNRKRLLEAARKAVEEDGAEVIVGGCGSQNWFRLGLQEELGVPVIDCAIAALKVAEFMADLYHNFGISHSRVGYFFPRGTFFG